MTGSCYLIAELANVCKPSRGFLLSFGWPSGASIASTKLRSFGPEPAGLLQPTVGWGFEQTERSGGKREEGRWIQQNRQSPHTQDTLAHTRMSMSAFTNLFGGGQKQQQGPSLLADWNSYATHTDVESGPTASTSSSDKLFSSAEQAGAKVSDFFKSGYSQVQSGISTASSSLPTAESFRYRWVGGDGGRAGGRQGGADRSADLLEQKAVTLSVPVPVQHTHRAAAHVLLLLLSCGWRLLDAGLLHFPAHHCRVPGQVCNELHARLPLHHGSVHQPARLEAAAAAYDIKKQAAVQCW